MNGYWDASVYSGARDISEDLGYRFALLDLWESMNEASTYCYANFSATTYEWGIMEDMNPDPPSEGAAEVAKLCYHVGVAVDTEYGLLGSSASLFHFIDRDAIEALENNFRYDEDAEHDDGLDIDLMTSEIQWLRPILMRGENEMGGHAWVVHGYNSLTDLTGRQFLMKMGWGGPSAWYCVDDVELEFTDGQDYCRLLAPKSVIRFVGNADSGDGSPYDAYGSIEDAVYGAPDDATLIFKTGSDNIVTARPLVITRPLTLKGRDISIHH